MPVVMSGFSYTHRDTLRDIRPRVIHKLDVFEWEKLSSFEKYLYLLQSSGTKILFEDNIVPGSLTFKVTR
jgi:hypothetical protein